MAVANYSMIVLIAAIVLWATMAIWRELVVDKLHRVEISNVQHYLDLAIQTSERPPPVRWGDRTIVSPPQGSEQNVIWNEPYLAVGSRFESLWLSGGWILSRPPAIIFHGGFALLALIAAVITAIHGAA